MNADLELFFKISGRSAIDLSSAKYFIITFLSLYAGKRIFLLEDLCLYVEN